MFYPLDRVLVFIREHATHKIPSGRNESRVGIDTQTYLSIASGQLAGSSFSALVEQSDTLFHSVSLEDDHHSYDSHDSIQSLAV